MHRIRKTPVLLTKITSKLLSCLAIYLISLPVIAAEDFDFSQAHAYIASAALKLEQIAPDVEIRYPFGLEFRPLDGPCGAMYFNGRIFLGAGGEHCSSPAKNESLVLHEYMHAIQDATLEAGSNLGQSSNEGFADLMAALLMNSPLIGEHLWNEEPSWTRNLEDNYFGVGEETGAYSQSLIMSTTWWQLRKWFSNESLIRLLLQSLVSVKRVPPSEASKLFHLSALRLMRSSPSESVHTCDVFQLFLKNKLIAKSAVSEFAICKPSSSEVAPVTQEFAFDIPLESANLTSNSFELVFDLASALKQTGNEFLLDSSKFSIGDVSLSIEVGGAYYENVGVVIEELASGQKKFYRGSEETAFEHLLIPPGRSWKLKLSTPMRALDHISKVRLRLEISEKPAKNKNF